MRGWHAYALVVCHENSPKCYSWQCGHFELYLNGRSPDFDLTHAILTPVKFGFSVVFRAKRVSPSFPNLSQIAHSTQKNARNLMIPMMSLCLVAVKSFIQKTTSNSVLFTNTRKYTRKNKYFLDVWTFSIIWTL